MFARVLAACLLPQAAFAEGFTVDALGTMRNQQACLDRADAFGQQVRAGFGIHSTGSLRYGLVIYDPRNHNPHDIVVVCHDGRATLVFSSTDDTTGAEREVDADRMIAIWNALP